MPSAICAASDSTSGRLGGLSLLLASARSRPRSIAVCGAPDSNPELALAHDVAHHLQLRPKCFITGKQVQK